MPETLPDSRARNSRFLGTRQGAHIVPFFCASCGVEMGKAVDRDVSEAMFFLCEANQNNCASRFGERVGLGKVESPSQIKYAKLAQAQLECFGRILTAEEFDVVMSEVDHPLAKLARELFPQLV